MTKISSRQFRDLLDGLITAPDAPGYGRLSSEIYRQGYSAAMQAAYERMVDRALDDMPAERSFMQRCFGSKS